MPLVLNKYWWNFAKVVLIYKLNIENVLNSTVAGGVAAGANADLV